MKTKSFIIILLISGFVGCRQRYEPKVKSLEQSFLVVEGNLNVGLDSTIIHLTRTFKLDDSAKLKAENNAILTVEGNDNSVRNLMTTGNGYYVSPNLHLIAGNEYRLRVKLADGNEYLSGYVKAKHTPDVDSISWERDNEGVHIYANTHDPSGNSKYYRWDCYETWEIKTNYFSNYIYLGGSLVRQRIFPDEDVSVCWKYNRVPEILVASSFRLQEDVIYKKPLVLIPEGNERLQVRYSILVKQYALEKEAYVFFEIMKRNTEEVGSFFGPQPSEIKGNIVCLTDPGEPVIGYVTASEEKYQRVFITIPRWPFSVSCYTINVPKSPDSIRYYFGTVGFMPYDDAVIAYNSGPPVCVDCTFRGGSTAKPSYW